MLSSYRPFAVRIITRNKFFIKRIFHFQRQTGLKNNKKKNSMLLWHTCNWFVHVCHSNMLFFILLFFKPKTVLRSPHIVITGSHKNRCKHTLLFNFAVFLNKYRLWHLKDTERCFSEYKRWRLLCWIILFKNDMWK